MTRYISAKWTEREKQFALKAKVKAKCSIRRIYGKSLLKDVYGCDCTSVHHQRDTVTRAYGACEIIRN
jgi:hypothetical protein